MLIRGADLNQDKSKEAYAMGAFFVLQWVRFICSKCTVPFRMDIVENMYTG